MFRLVMLFFMFFFMTFLVRALQLPEPPLAPGFNSARPLPIVQPILSSPAVLQPSPLNNMGVPAVGSNSVRPTDGTLSPVDPPAPQVLLRMRVPANVAPGSELNYIILVENPSLVPAHRVKVRDTTPLGARFIRATPQPENDGTDLVWNFGTLSPGAKKSISLTLLADGTGDIENTARVSFEHGESTRTKVSGSLQLTKKAPTSANVQDTWAYTLDVENTGQTALSNLQVTDSIPDGLEFLTSKPSTRGENPLTWIIDRLEPQQTKRIEYQVAAKKTGTYETKASVAVGGGQKRESACKTVVSEPKLELFLSGPDNRAVGRPATYHITVANEGGTTAHNVRLSTKMVQGTSFLGASSGGKEIQSEVRWDLGILQPSQRRTVNLVMKANASGQLTQRVEGSADRISFGIQTEKTTIFSAKNPILLELDKSVDPSEVGEPVTFTIRIINKGNSVLINSGLIVTLPEGYIQTEGRGPTAATKNGNTIQFAPLQRLDPGREAIFTIFATGSQPMVGKIGVEMTGTSAPTNKIHESIQVISLKTKVETTR